MISASSFCISMHSKHCHGFAAAEIGFLERQHDDGMVWKERSHVEQNNFTHGSFRWHDQQKLSELPCDDLENEKKAF